MANEIQILDKRRAAEVLIEDAVAELKKAEVAYETAKAAYERASGLVAFLRGYYDVPASTRQNGSAQHTLFEADEPGDAAEDDAGDAEQSDDTGYGAIRRAVFRVMLDANRYMTIRHITDRFVETGFQTGAKTPDRSVRNAVRGLVRHGKARRRGNQYRAIEPTAASP